MVEPPTSRLGLKCVVAAATNRSKGERHLQPWRCAMRKQFFAVVASTAALVLMTAVSHAQSSDPWIGTWKVNLEKSTYSPGPMPTVAAVVKMESVPNGLKTTIDGVNPQGEKTHTEAVANFDGKDYPVKGA